MSELKTKKKELFCREYIIDFNATRAAIKSGYSEKTAASIGHELLRKPDIQSRLSELVADRNERLKVDADYVLQRLVDIDQMDVLDILNDDGNTKPISDWPKVWRTTLSGLDISMLKSSESDLETIIKKIKWPDKVKNLELIGKHVNVKAFDGEPKQEGDGVIHSVKIEVVGASKNISD